MLDGRAEELADRCVKVARGSVERLKEAVKRVATSEGVEADALANYMAFRLSLQGEDWWGAAGNMRHSKSGEPWRTTRDFLVERLDMAALSELDRDLLRRALQG